MTLRVVEIFAGLQGESTRAGLPCVFVRLAGCDLDCTYCDTPQAHDPRAGSNMTIDQVVSAVGRHETLLVEITGGEPLRQAEGLAALAGRLLAAGRTVMLETNGCHDLTPLDPRIDMIMDVKTPGSGVADRLCRKNLRLLDGNDEVKFVLTGGEDYRWACRFLAENDLSRVRAVHFSPVWRQLSAVELAAWLRRDNPPARLAVQLHKLLGVA
ncbi:MAG: 4Fe-4S cluster-binding domain-containing protein [Anaerolineaceae bacterium]|nr:4Fe-4S cluster-binding domain-containing protein [Anaerolineaceae bacterium]